MDTYFKNTELAELYGMSEATVRNWVKSAIEGRLKLRIVEHNGRNYVAKDISNMPTIEELVRQNRKYRNTLASRTVRASNRLFETFNDAQVYDIIRNLELHHEVPVQYSYFGPGAGEWDEYIKRQARVDTPSMFSRTVELLADNESYIDKLLHEYKKVNIVDIGVGNAMPVKALLSRLLEQGKLARYIGIDFSPGMLELARGNIESWFEGRVEFVGRQLDIAHERFSDVFPDEYLQDEEAVNLVLFLGATPNNLREPRDAFRTICESMRPHDFLIYTDKLEPEDAPPEWYEHGANKYGKSEVMSLLKHVYDMLNIDESLYDIEVGIDRIMGQRYARTRFKVALTVEFMMNGIAKKRLYFEKGEIVTLWRCWQTTTRSLASLLDSTGFYVLHTSQSQDHNYILAIAEVKRS